MGYGGEDTDLAFRLRQHGVALRWCPFAEAVHLYHPVEEPPVSHLHDIVANARRFHRRWGIWPMPNWLGAFAEAGLVRWERDGEVLEVCGGAAAPDDRRAPEEPCSP